MNPSRASTLLARASFATSCAISLARELPSSSLRISWKSSSACAAGSVSSIKVAWSPKAPCRNSASAAHLMATPRKQQPWKISFSRSWARGKKEETSVGWSSLRTAPHQSTALWPSAPHQLVERLLALLAARQTAAARLYPRLAAHRRGRLAPADCGPAAGRHRPRHLFRLYRPAPAGSHRTADAGAGRPLSLLVAARSEER